MTYGALIDMLESHLLPCSIRELTGFACPGCGMQRALIALMRGDLVLSISTNPALIPFLITVMYTTLHLRSGYRQGPRNVLLLFCFTVSLMIANCIGRYAING